MEGNGNGIWARLLGFFDDQRVDEVLINGARSVMMVIGQRAEVGASPFASGQSMLQWLTQFARDQGVRLDPLCGSAGGMVAAEDLPTLLGQTGQLRWHALLPPLSQDGPLLALRRHRFGAISLENFGGPDALKERLSLAVAQKRSLLIAGPTGSGKSTLLVALLAAHASQERVMILESIAEIPALFPTWVRLLERLPNLEGVGAVSLDRLLKESLRLRPDRLVLGEIRGGEARPFRNALLSGHEGAMATIHAGSLGDARRRFDALASKSWGDGSGGPEGGKSEPNRDAMTTIDVVLMDRGSPPVIRDYSSGNLC
jgi:pilus assembly protein CpaF